ncbi:AAA family ATPase [Bacteroidales bacterium OttesenSCG-928-B11]|nr:AAA family ATPase [Bacteroidales bacterium OttesenSCG-928-C03]MDL2311773.1 AAA family ATPase [Bacteroidales bacterium OttesenSCG-928-B11]
METLTIIYERLLRHTNTSFIRYLHDRVAWNNRLIGIIGAKGTGKSTLLLQHIKLHFPDTSKALYVSLDNIWFAKHSLSELAEDFYNFGGTHLFLDEVHSYRSWAMEIKNIYDSYPSLHIVFTGSSMLEIFNASVDFSRRAVVYELKGLSFREFLKYENDLELPLFDLDEILKNHRSIAAEITSKVKILPELRKYWEYGYYPYYKENRETYPIQVEQSINKTLNEDFPAIENIEYATILKIKKLLVTIAEMVPFTPNIANLSAAIEINRHALVKYLYLLDKAGVILCITEANQTVQTLAKPQKVYLENTNIIYSLAFQNINMGNMRETFFANQLRAKHKVNTAKNGDFTIDEKAVFEVGGKSKSNSQIKNIENEYIAADDIEIGFANKIPLWLFGFLY